MPSSSESSRFPLSRIPSFNILQIMRRMDAKILCRFRQTSKFVDEFAEENRFQLNYYRKDSPWNFTIYRSYPEGGEGRGYKLEYSIYKSDGAMDCGRFISDCQHPVFYEDDYEIEDPYTQLSGISIGTIYISDYFVQRKPNVHYMVSESIETEPGQDVIHILRRLRLHVNWLWADCTCTPELLSIIRLSRIYCSYDSLTLSDMMSFSKKQALKELYWEKPVVPTSSDCISLLSKLEILSIDFEKFKDEQCYTQFITEIIQTTKSMKKEERTLKSLRLCYFDHNWPSFSLPFEQAHFYGFSPNEGIKHTRLDFHKIVAGNVVLIFLEATVWGKEYLEIFFIDDYSRSALFEAIWSYFYPIYPKEEVFEGFLNAETEKEAMKCLRESTANAVEYDIKENIRPTFKKAKIGYVE